MTKQVDVFTPKEYKDNFVKNPKAKKDKKEERLQLAVCDYIRNQYPGTIFMCDLASGLKLPIWLGVLHSKMRSSRGLPDLFIAKSKAMPNGFEKPYFYTINGLFIELKQAKVRLKSGDLASSPHLKEQLAILDQLNVQGFRAIVCCGFEEAKLAIDDYIK